MWVRVLVVYTGGRSVGSDVNANVYMYIGDDMYVYVDVYVCMWVWMRIYIYI